MAARALITGGGGFVGAALTRRLVRDGWDVHLALRTPVAPWRLADLAHCYTPRAADLRDPAAVRRAVDAARPDVVFHAAAHGATPGAADAAAVVESNALGTAHLLAALADHPDTAFVHTGSSSELGHVDGPIGEDVVPRPRTAYGVAKAAATLLVQAEHLKGRPASTVRIFSAYGPADDPARLVPYLMECCRTITPPRVTSGGVPRDWVFVDDVVDLLLAVAADPRRAGPIVNAGGGKDQTVGDMVEAVLDAATGGRLKAEYGAGVPRPDEPRRWVADLAGTTARTGWTPRTSLQDGAAACWNWFRSTPAAHAA